MITPEPVPRSRAVATSMDTTLSLTLSTMLVTDVGEESTGVAPPPVPRLAAESCTEEREVPVFAACSPAASATAAKRSPARFVGRHAGSRPSVSTGAPHGLGSGRAWAVVSPLNPLGAPPSGAQPVPAPPGPHGEAWPASGYTASVAVGCGAPGGPGAVGRDHHGSASPPPAAAQGLRSSLVIALILPVLPLRQASRNQSRPDAGRCPPGPQSAERVEPGSDPSQSVPHPGQHAAGRFWFVREGRDHRIDRLPRGVGDHGVHGPVPRPGDPLRQRVVDEDVGGTNPLPSPPADGSRVQPTRLLEQRQRGQPIGVAQVQRLVSSCAGCPGG